MDASGGVIDGCATQSGYYLCEEELPTPIKTGYNFLGWYLDTAIVYEPILDSVLVAKWEEITFDIIYELYGGENSPQNPESYGVRNRK